MHHSFFAGIAIFLAGLFGAHQAPSQVASAASSATVVDQSYQQQSPQVTASSTAATSTIIYQPVIERIIERSMPAVFGGVTKSELDARLQDLTGKFSTQLAKIAAVNVGVPNNFVTVPVFAQAGRIDNLANVSISNATVNGVTGLTDADIPDSITASNYLPLSGGSLTFASSTLLSVFNGAYFGATATSSFDTTGALTLATPLLASSGGTGWNNINTGSILFGNGASALATSSALFWDSANSRLGIGTTSPQTRLSIVGDGTNNSMSIEHPNTNYSAAGLKIDVPGVGTALNISMNGVNPWFHVNSHGIGAVGDGAGGHHPYIAVQYNSAIDSQIQLVAESLYDVYLQSQSLTTYHPNLHIKSDAELYLENTNYDIHLNPARKVITHLGADQNLWQWSYNGVSGIFAYNDAGDTFVPMQFYASKYQFLNGNVGIATTSPWRKLSVTGTVGFDGLTANFGAGSLCLTANKEVVYNSGSDSCLSSLRSTKHEISPLAIDAFSQLGALQPVSFIYNNDASSTVRYGFIAEDTAAVDPHLATYGADGSISGVDDRGLLAVLVSAIQGLMSRVGNFADSFTTKELTFTRATGDEITVRKANIQQANVQELCVGSTCLTESQVQALLNLAGQQPSAPSAPAPSESAESADASSTPEVIDAPTIVPDQSMATSTAM